MNIDPHNPWARAEPEDLLRLGITRVRFVYKRDHGAVDAALEKYIGAGLSVTLVLNNETVDLWGVPYTPEDWDEADWRDYRNVFNHVAMLAGRRYQGYGDRLRYEVWNEPDLPGHIPARFFGRMLQDASGILKREHPEALVISGALLQLQDPAVAHPLHSSYLAEARRAAPGMLDSVDFIGLHTYGPPEMFPQVVQHYADAFARPLAVTEWGRCEPEEARRFSDMRGFLSLFDRSDAVAEAYYFAWSNTQAPCSHYGITRGLERPDARGRLYALSPALGSLFRGQLQPPGPGPVTTPEAADEYFITQWGPTATYGGKVPYGYNDCGPAVVVMALASLGLMERPAAKDAATAIDAVRKEALGWNATYSRPMGFDALERALGHYGAGARRLGGRVVEAVDAAIGRGNPAILGGNPWKAWGRAERLAGNYLNSRDPGGHFILVLGKTEEGRYLVGDPLVRNGTIAVTAGQLTEYYQVWGFGIREVSRLSPAAVLTQLFEGPGRP